MDREAQLVEALRSITRYVLPYYEINGQKYVPLENAVALKQIAKDALALKEPTS